MQLSMGESATVDQYIAAFPEAVQAQLQTLRATIRAIVPDAGETIKYGMPTFLWHGNLVHFAAYKGHIGFYPTPSPIEEFKAELAPYKQTKGSIHFELDQPLPLPLIRRIVESRVRETEARLAARKQKKR